MSNIDHTLDMAANIKGAFAVAVVDYESGMTLGSRGGSAEFDLDVAAPGNSEVMRAKLDVMQKLGLRNEGIEDILITLGSQYHLIRPIQGAPDEKLFLYLALNKAQANLAMARRDLRVIEQEFFMAHPRRRAAATATRRRSSRPRPGIADRPRAAGAGCGTVRGAPPPRGERPGRRHRRRARAAAARRTDPRRRPGRRRQRDGARRLVRGRQATGAPDLELIGAQHAEIVRCALQMLRTWSGPAVRPTRARSSSARTAVSGTCCARCRTRSATGSPWRSSSTVRNACWTGSASGWRRCRWTH